MSFHNSLCSVLFLFQRGSDNTTNETRNSCELTRRQPRPQPPLVTTPCGWMGADPCSQVFPENLVEKKKTWNQTSGGGYSSRWRLLVLERDVWLCQSIVLYRLADCFEMLQGGFSIVSVIIHPEPLTMADCTACPWPPTQNKVTLDVWKCIQHLQFALSIFFLKSNVSSSDLSVF